MSKKNLLMHKVNGSDLPETIKRLGYEVFTTPYKLNIVGIRAATDHDNTFNDCIVVFWFDYNKVYNQVMYRATTDPGFKSLVYPINDKGCAILKEGQYIDTYGKGNHKGKPALIQQKNVVVYRDNDRDNELDFHNDTCESGMFGINIHRAGENSTYVDGWSAGCQVIASLADWNDFYQHLLLDPSVKYTYTLINENNLVCVE